MSRSRLAAGAVLAAELLYAGIFGVLGARAEAPEFTAVAETSVAYDRAVDSASPRDPASDSASWRAEQYANLRLRSALGEAGTFRAAFNVAAATGSAGPGGGGYAASVEVERLYASFAAEAFDLDLGLTRLAFGYGQAWSPCDFLAARNPAKPDARPRGVLAAVLAAYPADGLDARFFAAVPADPAAPSFADGRGAAFGAAADFNGRLGSAQGLYAFRAETGAAADGEHLFGLSLKGDLVLGFFADALWTFEAGADREFLRGLRASAGADYSFFDGKLVLLAQYLYEGAAEGLPAGIGAARPDVHHLFASAAWRADDYTTAVLSAVGGVDGRSALASVSVSHEIVQGATIVLDGDLPLDGRTFSEDGKAGAYGPEALGKRFGLGAKLKLRF